jgi:Fe-S-cluster containining protein
MSDDASRVPEDDQALDPAEMEARPAVPEDTEAGLRFAYQMGMETKQRVAELSASFWALVETFVASGLLPVDDWQERRGATARREAQRLRGESLVVLYDTPDKYAMTDLPEIDCEARLPLCRARCCGINFPLSQQDLDERVVRWDYARPYRIAKEPDGYCVHNDGDTRLCTIYSARPAFCRGFDCRNDKRIWVDFERRIPAVPAAEQVPATPPEPVAAVAAEAGGLDIDQEAGAARSLEVELAAVRPRDG